MDSVGGQRDSDTQEQALDLRPTGYGSTGYSKQDDDNRKLFVERVNQKLAEILAGDTEKIVVKDTTEPTISFQINQKEVYYLVELANAFYQFMSAEMDKSGKDLMEEHKLTDTQFADATTKGSYIQRQEEYNLGYLRQWFVRTRSIHPIISWLFQNYNPHMSQKINFSAAYWYSYSFISDLINFYGGETVKRWVGEVLNKLGENVKKTIEPYIDSWLKSTSSTQA